jgi:hypothetical protein
MYGQEAVTPPRNPEEPISSRLTLRHTHDQFAGIGSGAAVAVMRNRRSTGDFAAAARAGHLVIDAPDRQGAADE